MKKVILSAIAIVSLLLITGTVFAVKPSTNLARAQKVDWNLSGAVMPLPWGQHDIIGSDTASKLIVNQPNGNIEVAITGVMKGLHPNSTYQVYPSNAWSSSLVWDVTGSYGINVRYLGVDYPETLILAQSGTNITGVSLDTNPPGSFFTVFDGSVVGDEINIFANKGSLVVHMIGTIAPNGSMSGTWQDEVPGTRDGTWETESGEAISQSVGNGYPGLFGSLQMFTFTTNEFGTGSWHINLRDEDFSGAGTHNMSIWVNQPGATILISDNFEVVVD